jgi:hypothetical protein
MAMSSTFVYLSIDTTSDLSYDLSVKEYNSYIKFRVIAESDNDAIMDESNEIDVFYPDTEKFEITALN